ncbi:MAG TPA: hypothetical protein VGV41_18185 [Pseudolabrys sp.]|uniref:hypothetical protein n=1 Tax=Pseudolabrys sp. TaxID=1960880 RepID=UPI002DDDAA19|nr:hypothetical protein [Pseudolabrys sp.]HEV2630562.1 hypothetical protein [Pseudolabrys sp.]
MIVIAHSIQTVFASSDAWGYAASSLVLMTFCMKRMVPLRIVAICSNLAFFAYGLLLHLMPILLLHALLMPINLVRLLQAAKVTIGRRPSWAWPVDQLARVWSQARGGP